MGASASSIAHDDKVIARWKQINNIKDIKEKFISDGTLASACTDNELELRALLEDEVAFVHLRRYAIRHGNKTVILCWRILEEYASVIQRGEDSLDKLLNISNLCFSSTENEEYLAQFDQYRTRIEYLINNPAKLKEGEDSLIYNCLHMVCFDCMLTTIYLPFKTQSPYEYSSMCAAIRANYNQVSPCDFEYSRVTMAARTTVTLACRKRRTGTKFIMKVQLKAGLLAHNCSHPSDVIMDMSANSMCRHPYLTNLAYAFQTPKLAIMIFPTSVSMSINSMLLNSPQNRFTISRVQFYAAELVSALCFLHENDVIYHHLNIYTVSITDAGHVLLSDFGSTVSRAARKEGSVSRTNSFSLRSEYSSNNSEVRSHFNDDSEGGAPDFSIMHAALAALDDAADEEEGEIDNSASVVDEEDEEGGTSRITLQARIDFLVRKMKRGRGGRSADYIPYVAPEVSMLLACPDTVQEEDYCFSDAIDWWCLGVLLYRLLVGRYPFKVLSLQQIQSTLPETVKRCNGDIGFAFTSVFGEVDYQTFVDLLSAEAIDLVSGLLEINIVERLGVTTMTRDDCAAEEGISAHSLIKKHHFFDDIDIDLVESNELLPPYSFDDDGIVNIPKPTTIITSLPTSGVNTRPTTPSMASEGNLAAAVVPEISSTHWCSFNEIMTSCDKQSWLEDDLESKITKRPKSEDDIIPQAKSSVNIDNNSNHVGVGINGESDVKTASQNVTISKKAQLYFMDWNYVSQAVIQQEGDIFKGKPGAFITKVLGWNKNKKGFMK